jgi:hypothetical protein
MPRLFDPRLQPLKELLQGATAITIVDPYILQDEKSLIAILPPTLKRLHLAYRDTHTGYNTLWYLDMNLKHVEISTQIVPDFEDCVWFIDGRRNGYIIGHSVNQLGEQPVRYAAMKNGTYRLVADYMIRAQVHPFGELGPALAQIHRHFIYAEDAYDAMYEAKKPYQRADSHKNFMASFQVAIEVANQHGLSLEVENITKRMKHCDDVYRGQFSSRY